jgi:hypothetical protein
MEITSQINEVLKDFKELHYFEDEKCFRGKIFILDDDFYEVEIRINEFPNAFPIVKETLLRIPRKPDRHVYTDTQSLCFTTKAKADIFLKTKIKTIKHFILEILIPYLRNNSYYEINGKYFNEEYSHGALGILESYKDILKIEKRDKIIKVINDRLKGRNIRNCEVCYCGSGKSLVNCSNGKHIRGYQKLKLISLSCLRNDLTLILGKTKSAL